MNEDYVAIPYTKGEEDFNNQLFKVENTPPNCYKLRPGEVFSVNLAVAINNKQCLFNSGMFSIRKIYKERIVPRRWLDRIKFWKWISKQVMFELEYIGR